MAKNNGHIIECKDVRKTYILHKEKVDVLKNLDLQVKKGETVLIEGRSGCGKSTLINLICGIDSLTRGDILFNNISYKSMNNEQLSKHRRENIGIIFQNFNLITLWTAYENIEAGLINSQLSKDARKKLIEGYLDELGMLKYKNHKPKELSIGQQQRVAVIRALINEPTLILGDEPIGDVDKETGEDIMKLITKIQRKNNATMIITTHGEFPHKYADRVLAMSKGKLK